MAALELLLTQLSPGSEFQRAFILFTIGMLLYPTAKSTTFVRQLWSLVDVDGTSTYNWAKMVLDWLCEEFRKFQTNKQTYYSGYGLLLVVSILHVVFPC